MSRYNGGIVKLDENKYNNILENCKQSTYSKILELGFVSEWRIIYGFDHACGYFFQFEKITIDDFEGEQLVELDYLFNGLSGAEFGYVLKQFSDGTDSTINLHATYAYLDVEF